MENIKPGSIIQGPLWPEPVEVKFVVEMGDYLHETMGTLLGFKVYSD